MRALLFTTLGVLAVACAQSALAPQSGPARPLPLELAPAAAIPAAPQLLMMTGVIVRPELELRTATAGVVRRIHVRLGNTVHRGQLLVTLDAREAGVDVVAKLSSADAAEAERERAAAFMAQAVERDRRSQTARQYLNPEEVSASAYAVRLAEAEVKAAAGRSLEARAVAVAAKLRHGHLEVRAPIDGVIGDCFVVTGAAVAAQALLVRLVGDDAPRVRFAVPESALKQVGLGQRVAVDLESLGLRLVAAVDALSPDVDTLTGLRFAEASFEDGSELPAGVSAVVTLEGSP